MKVKYLGFRNLQEKVKIIYLPFEIGDGGGVFFAQIFLAMGSGDLTGGVCLPLFRQNVLKFKKKMYCEAEFCLKAKKQPTS